MMDGQHKNKINSKLNGGVMSEKQNPWLDEGTRFEGQEKKKKDVRDMVFKDNTKHNIRILPQKNVNDFPFFGYKQHWIPQNGSTIGKPITHGIDDRCAVCEWVALQWEEIHRLKDEEDMTDKSPEVVAIAEKIRKVNAKSRYDMNILHREDLYVVNEETGAKTLAQKRMSSVSTVYKEVFGFAKKWGSPSHEKTGYDLEISTTGSKEKREYHTMPDRVESPLSKDEIALLDNLYDLKSLRMFTTNTDVIKNLENAKSPYNEILFFVKDYRASDSTEQVEKEIQEVTKEQKNALKAIAGEGNITRFQNKIKSEDIKEAVVEETVVEETVVNTNENNIEDYECKGDYDENDKLCSSCPVQSNCEDAHPFYLKAVQFKIDTDPRTRKTTEVIDDVKKAESDDVKKAESSPKRGKKIPF